MRPEPADAGGPGIWGSAAEDGRAAAARRTPLEIVEKVLTNSAPLNENCSRSLKAAILRDGQAAATNGRKGPS